MFYKEKESIYSSPVTFILYWLNKFLKFEVPGYVKFRNFDIKFRAKKLLFGEVEILNIFNFVLNPFSAAFF